MEDDLRNFAEFPREWKWPRTSLGRWSLWLIAGFIALMVLFFALVSIYGGFNELFRLSAKGGGGFFSLPLFALTLVAAFGLAFAAGVAAALAIKRNGEHSIVMLLPLFMGGVGTMFFIALMIGYFEH